MSELRGRWYDFRGTKLAVTYHPAFLLRDPRQKKETWKDLQMVMKKMGLAAARESLRNKISLPTFACGNATRSPNMEPSLESRAHFPDAALNPLPLHSFSMTANCARDGGSLSSPWSYF